MAEVAPTLPSQNLSRGVDADINGGLVAGTVSAKWAKGTGGPAGDECQNLVAHSLCRRFDSGADPSKDNLLAFNLRGDRAIDSVRRLTPLECERLMGLPDRFTAVPNERGKPMSDSARYKLLGNAIAVNCLRWLGDRIELFETL